MGLPDRKKPFLSCHIRVQSTGVSSPSPFPCQMFIVEFWRFPGNLQPSLLWLALQGTWEATLFPLLNPSDQRSPLSSFPGCSRHDQSSTGEAGRKPIPDAELRQQDFRCHSTLETNRPQKLIPMHFLSALTGWAFGQRWGRGGEE